MGHYGMVHFSLTTSVQDVPMRVGSMAREHPWWKHDAFGSFQVCSYAKMASEMVIPHASLICHRL